MSFSLPSSFSLTVKEISDTQRGWKRRKKTSRELPAHCSQDNNVCL
jgi:hypothetical protein